MPGPVCLNFPLGLMMASGGKWPREDTGPGWGMSSYSVQRGGRVGEQLQVRARGGLVPAQARLHLIDNSFPRGSARPARLARGGQTGSGAARGQECRE